MTTSVLHGGLLAHDPQAQTLWGKLCGLSFDQGTGPNTFAARLASEQGWSAEFTGRVIEEYRRFLLLFVLEQRQEKANPTSSGNAPMVRIVPSAAVDKAWHLHLLYTQSYWGTLCRDILGEPLHHQPADGSPGEAAALDRVYCAIMEIYRTTFGELAPGDVWPAPKGTPPLGMPLAEILQREGPAPGTNRAGRYLLLASILAPVASYVLMRQANFLSSDSLMGALAMTGGIVIVVGACISLFVAMVLNQGGSRRRTVNGCGETVFFCGGESGESSASSGCEGGSHGDHGGHGDSGGGHGCGGHGCGGHGCGGH